MNSHMDKTLNCIILVALWWWPHCSKQNRNIDDLYCISCAFAHRWWLHHSMERQRVNPFSKALFSMWQISLYFHSSKIKLLVKRAVFTSLLESPSTLQAELNLQETEILSFAARKPGAGSWEGAGLHSKFSAIRVSYNMTHSSSDAKLKCPWLSCCLGSLWS